jgi:O-antigen/teichoic acid export membrane protein
MSLRQRALSGGAILVVRQAIGTLLSLTGVLLVTRVIGPAKYGVYAAAIGIVLFLCVMAVWGLDVYLLRKPSEPTKEEFDQAFTLLFALGISLALTLILLRKAIAGLLHLPDVAPILATLAAGVPINLLTIPAVVKLDRDLNFKRVAFNELVSQSSYYVLAVPLALRGAGSWAPTAGWLVQQVSLFLLSHASVDLKPRLHWNPRLLRDMVSYGLSYSSSIWVWQLRGLVNPVIVGRFAGAEAVGFVAVGLRLAEVLSFARSATWRLAMAALAKLNMDPARLRRGISEGMRLQALLVGLPLAAFALLAPAGLPLALGHRWAPALSVFPFIAIGCLSNAMFNLHSSVLYLLRRNLQVTWFHCVYILLFAGSAALLVPRIGFPGYGWAEVAALPSYLIIHWFLVRAIGKPSYRVAALWYSTTACILLLSFAGEPIRYLGFLLLGLPLLFSEERSTLWSYAQILLSRANA